MKKGIYQHFKGGLYQVLYIAKNSETLEEMVVYQSLDNKSIWVRPLSMWNEIIERDGKTFKRFTFIKENIDKN